MRPAIRRAVLAGSGVLAALCAPAAAHDPAPVYDRVNLSAEASREVENDLLVAVLYAEREGASQSALADEVNRTVAWGVEHAKRAAGIEVQTLGYQTNPVYRNQNLAGWRVRQSIRLESRDSAALAALVGDLQERLAVQSMGYDLAAATRRAAEDALIAEALSSFRARADLVARELGRQRFRIVHIDVSASRHGPPPGLMRGAAVGAMEMKAAPPTLEAGGQEVSVHVSGTIELEALTQ